MDESPRKEVTLARPVNDRRCLLEAERASLHLRTGEGGLAQLVEAYESQAEVFREQVRRFTLGVDGDLSVWIAASAGASGGCFITTTMSNWLIFQLLGPMPVKLIRSLSSPEGER